MPDFRGGDQAVISYAPESASMASYPFSTMPAVPGTTPTIMGTSDIPEARRERNNKKARGAGSPYAIYNAKGVRRYVVNVNMRINHIPLLSYCVRNDATGQAYKGLRPLCLYVDANDSYGEGGLRRIIRYAMCDQLTLGFPQDGPELVATARFIGIAEYAGAAPALSVASLDSTLRTFGPALTWHDVSSVSALAGSVSLRDVLSNIQITLNNNIQGIGCRPNSLADANLRNTHYALRPGSVDVSANFGFNTDIPSTLASALLSTDEWGDVPIACSDGSKSMTATLRRVLLGEDSWGGGDPRNSIQSGCTASADNLIIT